MIAKMFSAGVSRLASRNSVAAVILATVFSGSAVQAETLRQALSSAYLESGLLEQNRALLRAADEDVAIAVSALRPVLRYVASADYTSDPGFADNLSGNIALTGELSLYDFGRNRLSIEAAKETVLATREALVSIEQQVLQRAVAAYMSVRREVEFRRIRQNNVRLLTEELRAARDRFEVGEVTRTDVALAESRLAAARAGLAATEGALAQAREEYRAAVGAYPGTLAPPPPLPQTANSRDSAQAVAQANHPDVRQAQREVTVTELNILRAKADRNPSITLNGAASVDDDGNDVSNIGIEFGGVIYQGGQIRALERRAAARRDSARAALLLATEAVIRNAGNAWADISVARAQLEATRRQVEAARIAFEGAREEAALGARTTLDVLDAEQELLDAQADQISAEADLQIATYDLLASMGYLTVDHLGLGVTTYDPNDYFEAVRNAPLNPPTSEQGRRLDALLESIGRNE